jgi:uroporphyrinogen III methyltransferase / synthase
VNELHGVRVIVTRPPPKADALCERLESLGAITLRMPAIEITDAAGDDASAALLRTLRSYDWVVFTSANGVRFGLMRLAAAGIGPADWNGVRVAAVGPATAAELHANGITVHAVPEEHVAEHIADAIPDITGHRFLLLRGDLATPDLPRRLREAGGHVDEVTVYVTRQPALSRDATPVSANDHTNGGAVSKEADLMANGADAITFTSPSTVRGFLESAGERGQHVARCAAIITIGPVTSDAVREAGFAVAAEADPHTMDGLIDALIAWFTARNRGTDG